MSRDLTSGLAAELIASKLRPVLFYEAEFDNGTLRFWSGAGSKSWNGQTWLGTGNLIGISEVTEAAGIFTQRMTVQISGAPPATLAYVQLHAQQGLPGKIWLGALDASGAVIADPYQTFDGRLEVPAIKLAPNACIVEISYGSHMSDILRPRVFRWDDETQKIFFPQSRGFEYVSGLKDQTLVW